ncbi:hypothetical protein [Pseudoalteromonas aurantia]|uniref:Phage protein n=1 Tax=Pseudoalteromonas aurantia 208 TaxID=1314867 RepID=A0ABR9EE38_9GAMM|nr:hypothetical protein [Pseudoalteromonas aurantia]MBE0369235.1 hypothetical protein [Pseudoalteromonas aurantia 208]
MRTLEEIIDNRIEALEFYLDSCIKESRTISRKEWDFIRNDIVFFEDICWRKAKELSAKLCAVKVAESGNG